MDRNDKPKNFKEFLGKYKNIIIYIILGVISLSIAIGLYVNQNNKEEYTEQSITEFVKILEDEEKIKEITGEVVINEKSRIIKYEMGEEKYEVKYTSGFVSEDDNYLVKKLSTTDAEVKIEENKFIRIFDIAFRLVYIGFFIILLYFIVKQFGLFDDLKIIQVEKETTTFKDIAGYKYVKEELQEVIDFLNNPKEYEKYHSKMIRGVLLEGPPGNGKTLFAKGIAGEVKIPFFQISASDIEDKFVGSGSRRVEKVFSTVRKAAEKHGSAILFVDEIDAIGMSRESRTVVETNQTINKFLTEMDGFDKDSGILVIAATNFAKSLDPALTRAGRFDKIIAIPRPNLKDREEVIRLYLDKKSDLISEEVYKENYPYTLAQQTEGFSNADIDKLINEATLIIKKDNKEKIDIETLRKSYTKLIAGLQMEHNISEEDKKIIAYHEAAHATAQVITSEKGYKSVAYITITPYGQSLGHVAPVSDNKVLYKKSDLENEVIVLLAGRAIEDKLLNGDYTTGASSDLEKANKTILNYVTKYGMSDNLENFYLEEVDGDNKVVHEEVKRIRENLYNQTIKLLEKHHDVVEVIAEHLLKYEAIDQPELLDLLKDTSYTKIHKIENN